MSEEKKNSSVGLQIEAPSPVPDRINYDIDLGNLPKWVCVWPKLNKIKKYHDERKWIKLLKFLFMLSTRPLTIEEKKFLLAVERGDVANVRRFVFMNDV